MYGWVVHSVLVFHFAVSWFSINLKIFFQNTLHSFTTEDSCRDSLQESCVVKECSVFWKKILRLLNHETAK